MKTKPRVLSWVAAFLVGVAAGMPLQIMFLYGHSPLELAPIAAKLAPMNWAIMLFAPVAAWLVLRASPFTLLLVPILCVLVARNNFLVAQLSEDFSPLTASLGTVAFLAALSPLAMQPVRGLLIYPERRWWLTPARRRLEVPIVLSDEGRELVATTFDISVSGIFVTIKISGKVTNPEELHPGKVLGLSLDIPTGHSEAPKERAHVSCLAEVVRLTRGSGRLPDGIGLRFLDLPERARTAIASFAA